MFTRAICVMLSCLFLHTTLTCTVTRRVTTDEEVLPQTDILAAVMPDGSITRFEDRSGYYDPRTHSVVGREEDGRWVTIPLQDILYLEVKRIDPVASTVAAVLVVGGLIAGVVGIIALTKESCPFVYSFTGDGYVLDAEPLGGAVCKGLERSELSSLENIRPVDGKYRLLVRNEVEETQYLDQFSLLFVDHAPGAKVIADLEGDLHLVRDPIEPLDARDEKGMNLLPFVRRTDGIVWQSHMPSSAPSKLTIPRHHLTFRFPRPEGADHALLLINAGTTLWGSNMIREMLELRGRSLEAWYTDVDRQGPQYDELMRFLTREELWHLHIRTARDSSVGVLASIRGAGPLVVEDRAVPLDLTGLVADTLVLEVFPPYGFWTIDYLALSYGTRPMHPPREIGLTRALSHQGVDITDRLRRTDAMYHTMPQVGDYFEAVFEVPDFVEDQSRAVFLRSHGYYSIHLDQTAEPLVAKLRWIVETPGAAVEYAHEKYLEFLNELTARPQ